MDTTNSTPPVPPTPPAPSGGTPPVPPADKPQDPVAPPVPPVTPPTPETPPAIPPVPPPPPATPTEASIPPVPPPPPATPETPAVPPPSAAPEAPTTQASPPAETPTEAPKEPETPAPEPTIAPPAGDPTAPPQTTEVKPEEKVAELPPTDHPGKKGVSKAIMISVVLLLVGAFSAVFVVANMQPGQTQSSASTPTDVPSLPTSTPTPQAAVTNDTNLTISSPVAGSTVTESIVQVTGKTFPAAEVFINDLELKADATGAFTTKLTLDEGENTISISANDADGNASEKEMTVTYQAQ